MWGIFLQSCNQRQEWLSERKRRPPGIRDPGIGRGGPSDAHAAVVSIALCPPPSTSGSFTWTTSLPDSTEERLARQSAFACLHRNRHKGPNIARTDLMSGELVRLLNPRLDQRSDHFERRGAVMAGKTAIGRVTVHVLSINDPDFVAVREQLQRSRYSHWIR